MWIGLSTKKNLQVLWDVFLMICTFWGLGHDNIWSRKQTQPLGLHLPQNMLRVLLPSRHWDNQSSHFQIHILCLDYFDLSRGNLASTNLGFFLFQSTYIKFSVCTIILTPRGYTRSMAFEWCVPNEIGKGGLCRIQFAGFFL